MNYFSKFKFAIWAIIILAVIILTAVATGLYIHHDMQQHGKNKMDFKGGINQMFKTELGLSPDQEVKLKKINESFFKNTHPFFMQLEEERVKMVAEFSRPQPDTVVLYKMATDMGNVHVLLKRETIKHLLLIRSICTPEQVVKLNKLNNKLIAPEGPMRHKHNENVKGQ